MIRASRQKLAGMPLRVLTTVRLSACLNRHSALSPSLCCVLGFAVTHRVDLSPQIVFKFHFGSFGRQSFLILYGPVCRGGMEYLNSDRSGLNPCSAFFSLSVFHSWRLVCFLALFWQWSWVRPTVPEWQEERTYLHSVFMMQITVTNPDKRTIGFAWVVPHGFE